MFDSIKQKAIMEILEEEIILYKLSILSCHDPFKMLFEELEGVKTRIRARTKRYIPFPQDARNTFSEIYELRSCVHMS